MRCPICGREVIPGGNFCDRHTVAYRKLLEGFKSWKKALRIGWKEYLRAVKENPHTGVWVKEVAAHLAEEKASPLKIR
ncbi:hypothetical protein DRO53_01065 [Candidatus Bathyarchaeota archaeon]|nr:MAG: hypothetical protein DRO46_02685 [Candidatus Hecatellales archaeon]RLI35509.1 MAG: hypothetical protein DRO53_01065 [Candidatus Bathyarchaeota archaeon]